jgi:hypothetical protein
MTSTYIQFVKSEMRKRPKDVPVSEFMKKIAAEWKAKKGSGEPVPRVPVLTVKTPRRTR